MILAVLVWLSGCEQQRKSFDKTANVVALADQQRHRIIKQTRNSSYSVFSDTDDIRKMSDPTFLDAMHAVTPTGSAFGVSANGLVFTNVHVIEGGNFCTAPEATEGALRRSGASDTYCLLITPDFKKIYRAKLIKLDRVNDIALLRIDEKEGGLPFLELAQKGSFDEGTEVLTVGSPLGQMNIVTPGFLSNLNYYHEDKETGEKGARKIQFSAALLPGNSGGPLVSVATGEVVGQAVAIFTMGPIPTQMSYANPVEFLRENLLDIPLE